jgi:hypothetical protein
MALWIWGMAMSRIFRDAASGVSNGRENSLASDLENESRIVAPPPVRLSDYLQSEIIANPLPAGLLDRLADLYWAERDFDELVI